MKDRQRDPSRTCGIRAESESLKIKELSVSLRLPVEKEFDFQ